MTRETGKVKALWKDDLPHHIHTHLSSGQTLKERGRQEEESFILEPGHLLTIPSQYQTILEPSSFQDLPTASL